MAQPSVNGNCAAYFLTPIDVPINGGGIMPCAVGRDAMATVMLECLQRSNTRRYLKDKGTPWKRRERTKH